MNTIRHPEESALQDLGSATPQDRLQICRKGSRSFVLGWSSIWFVSYCLEVFGQHLEDRHAHILKVIARLEEILRRRIEERDTVRSRIPDRKETPIPRIFMQPNDWLSKSKSSFQRWSERTSQGCYFFEHFRAVSRFFDFPFLRVFISNSGLWCQW